MAILNYQVQLIFFQEQTYILMCLTAGSYISQQDIQLISQCVWQGFHRINQCQLNFSRNYWLMHMHDISFMYINQSFVRKFNLIHHHFRLDPSFTAHPEDFYHRQSCNDSRKTNLKDWFHVSTSTKPEDLFKSKFYMSTCKSYVMVAKPQLDMEWLEFLA